MNDRGGSIRLRRMTCIAVAVAVLSSGTALGQGEADPRKTVAVMNLKAVMDEAPTGLRGLSELIASELARFDGLAIITSADIDSLLGLESQKQLLGCNDDSMSCLAEIGGALGVQYLVAGQISKLGDIWLLTMVLIDTENSQAVHRKTRRADSESALVNVAVESARDLAFHILPEGIVPKEVRGPADSGVARTVGLWAGLTTAVVGAGLYGSGWLTQAAHDRSQGPDDDPAITFKQATAARQRSGIGIGMAVGGAAIALGSLLVFAPTPEDSLSLHLTPTRDGAMVLVGVSW